MNVLSKMSLAAALLVFVSGASAEAQSTKEKFNACVDRKSAELIAAKSQGLSSPEYRVTCNAGDIVDFVRCRKHNRNNTFVYEAPAGFVISGGSFNTTSQTPRTSVNDFSVFESGTKAKIRLQCSGHACDRNDRVWVAGRITGTLTYQPTLADSKKISDACFDEVVK